MLTVHLASIIAGILYGLTESLNKNITERKYSVFSYSLIQNLGNLILYFIPFLIFGSIPSNPLVFVYIFILAVLIFVGNAFIIKAYQTEEISNINIISRFSLVVAFLTGVLLLNEPITTMHILGIVSVILGIFIIFYEKKELEFSSGFLFALLSGLIFGFIAFFDKKALEFTDPLSLFVIFYIISVVLLIFTPKALRDIKPIFQKYKRKIILSRISAVIGFYLFIWSISKGKISIVNTNYETMFLISTLFIGVIILNEKKNILKKLAGSSLCIIGIILLNFF